MIWLLASAVVAEITTYIHNEDTMYIVPPREISREQFPAIWATEALEIRPMGLNLAPTLKLPICTINAKNRCECKIAISADYRTDACIEGDGRRDLKGNCHLDITIHCEVKSDLRPSLNDYEWKDHKVYLQYPYGSPFGYSNKVPIRLNGEDYYRFCNVRPFHDYCECSIRKKVGYSETRCTPLTGEVAVDPALARCHLAVKTFADGSFVCFPIEDPRPSKADLEELKRGLPEDGYVGVIAMNFVETKPDGIVLGFETRPVEPKPPMIDSTMEPDKVKGSKVQYRIPMSPFGKTVKHKLIFPSGLVTLASCTFEGAKLHLFIRNEHKCTHLEHSEKEVYSADACLIIIDVIELKALYNQIDKYPHLPHEESVCSTSPAPKGMFYDIL